jgi:prepilin-type N-terminal cleavage/methylation domain-containing protein
MFPAQAGIGWLLYMKNSKKGFTLIELVVVVIIVGILTAVGMPQYFKTIENSKAVNASATGHMIAAAYRMYFIGNPDAGLQGTLDNTCNTGSCDSTDLTACRLVRCNYTPQQDWDAGAYLYQVAIPNTAILVTGTGQPFALRANRREGDTSPGTNTWPYNRWSYLFDTAGGCAASSAVVPPCPIF